MTPDIKKEHPQGMVLLFVLGILALLMILVSTIFMTTQDEVQVSSENLVSREAFTKADLTARVAVFLARASLKSSAGKPADSLLDGGIAGRPEFAIVLNNFSPENFLDIDDQATAEQIRDRYILAADGSSSVRPHVEVYYQYDNSPTSRQLIGTAAVARGTSRLDDIGGRGEGQYDNIPSNPGSVVVFLVVSANGRVPLRTAGGPLEVDPSNYFTGAENAKHSIVTTIYQDLP